MRAMRLNDWKQNLNKSKSMKNLPYKRQNIQSQIRALEHKSAKVN